MPIPTAKVKIEILNIYGVPAAAMVAPNTRYAHATVVAGSNPQLVTGRSRPIPDAGGTFDVTAEAVPWVVELSLNPGDSVAIAVKIAQDLGDSAPPAETSITATVSDPWKGGVQTVGAPLGISFRVTTTLIDPTDAGYLARAQAAGISGALVVPQGFIVQFEDILGLFKPNPPAPPPARGSSHVVGYISDDNLGRIFTNRLPSGNWKRDTQFIDVKLKVTAFGAPVIPAGAKIRWTVTDPDDPTNDASNFHRDWGPYIDQNDYGPGPGFAPLGAHGSDNALAFSPGNADESKLFAVGKSGNARWDKTTGGPAPAPSSQTQAESPLTIVTPKSAKTSVRIHCPNVLGTNLTVKAELIGTPAPIPVHNAFTGVMTMWNRINVEVKRMAGAFSLAGALPNIPQYFLPACVQLDFQPQVTVGGPLDKLNLAASDDLEETGTAAWVNSAFANKANPGWFFLGAARRASPLPAGPRPLPLFRGTAFTLGTSGTDVFVEVAGSFPGAFFVRFNWKVAGRKQFTSFRVIQPPTIAGGNTRMFLVGNDVTPLFTGHDADGSISHAYATERLYYPQHELPPGAGALSPGGFGIPSPGAILTIQPLGSVFTSGMSPSVNVAGAPFFAGRTVIFTGTPSYAAAFLPVPEKPAVTRNAGAGTFAAGRDVYIATTFVNGHGETEISDPFSFNGTTANDQFALPSPTLTPWFTALAGANAVTGYNVYEADVPAGAMEPTDSAFKKVNAALISIGTPTLVNNAAAGAAPPAQNSAANLPTTAVDHFDSKIVSTVVHEFTHAFGMPHKCGYWDWRTPREKSCSMNYFNTWLLSPAPAFSVLPDTVRKQGDNLCGRHLMEVRRVHLERNKALKSLGW